MDAPNGAATGAAKTPMVASRMTKAAIENLIVTLLNALIDMGCFSVLASEMLW